jgi:GT2 family glycosyltransferase
MSGEAPLPRAASRHDAQGSRRRASQDPGAQRLPADRVPLAHSVSVVITTFRRPGLLPAVVRPHVSDDAVTEVIIVDDGSGDETEAVCAELASQSPKVKPFTQPNAGPAAARARGAAAATGEIILFIDDDVVTTDGVASSHLALHLRAPVPLVLVGYMPTHLPSPRRAGDFPAFVYERNYERMCQIYEKDSSRVLLNLWSGHFSVRRDVFLSTLGAQAKVPGHEDRLLGWELRRAGCKGVFDRSLTSEHRYTRTPQQFFAWCRRSGRAQAVLHTLAPLEADVAVDAELGLPGRVALRILTQRPSEFRPLLTRGISAVGWLRWWSAETLLARALATLEMQVAFTESRGG